MFSARNKCESFTKPFIWAYQQGRVFCKSTYVAITGHHFSHLPRYVSHSWLAPLLGVIPEFCAEAGLGTSKGIIKSAALAENADGAAYYSLFIWPALVVTEPAYYQQFVRNQYKFSRSDVVKNNFGFGFGMRTLFTTESHVNGHTKTPDWAARRKDHEAVLTGKNLQAMAGIVDRVIKSVLDKVDADILAASDQSITLNMEAFCSRMTMLVAAKTWLGVPEEDTEFEKHIEEFTQAFNKLLKEIFNHKNAMKYGLKKLFGCQREIALETARRELRELTVKYFLRPYRNHILQTDNLIRNLAALDPQNAGKNPEDFTLETEEIIDNTNLELLVGHDTVSRLFQFGTMYQARYQHWQQRLHAEATAKQHQGPWTQAETEELPEMKAFLNEVGRLHPGAPIVGMLANEDVTFKDKHNHEHVLKRNGYLIMPIFTLHRSSKIYKDPLQFNPDRFLQPDVKFNRFQFSPFGFGHRFCPAQLFGPYEAAVALLNMLERGYQLAIDIPDNGLPFECDLLGTLRHKGPVMLTLSKKQKPDLTQEYKP